MSTGAASKIVIGFQADIETVATAGFVMPINTSSLKPSRPKNKPATIRGNRNPAMPFDGNLSISGDITVPVDSVAFWYWLRAAMGDPTTAGADPYTHTYALGNARPYLTIEDQVIDLSSARYIRYTGCKIGSMKISMGGSGELLATFSVVGRSRSIETASFDGSATDVPMARLQNRHLTVTENSVDYDDCPSFELNVDFDLDTGDDQYCIGGGGLIGDIPDGVYGVSGSMKTLFKNVDLLSKAMAGAETSVVATLANGSDSGIAFTLPEIQFEEAGSGIDGPKGRLLTLPYQAYYEDASEATALQVVLTNGEAHA